MAHLYHTKAYILEVKKSREKDLVLVVFTSEFGLLRVGVKSVRDVKSKLRYHIRLFGRINLSLVKGKEMWRVVGVEDDDFMTEILTSKLKLEVSSKIFSLIKRLVNGEEENKELFETLNQSMGVLVEVANQSTNDLLNLECVTVLRVLNKLGFLRDVPIVRPFISGQVLDKSLILSMEPIRPETIKLINKTFYEADV